MATKLKHETNKPQRLAKGVSKLRGMRGMDDHEKVLFARFAAATPDERWQMNVTFLRSLGLWGRSSLKKFSSNS